MKHDVFPQLPSTDASAPPLFDEGWIGSAHVRAHQAMDEGRLADGLEDLSSVLEGHEDSGPKWAHLQWHALVFELSLHRVDEALVRYERELAPAVRRGVAVTDGPSALWRLMLANPQLRLDWDEARRRALVRLAKEEDRPFVTLHHLLALAGARDHGALSTFVAQTGDLTLATCAQALLAWIEGDDHTTVRRLDALTPHQRRWIGGSRAQNELLGSIRDKATRRAMGIAA